MIAGEAFFLGEGLLHAIAGAPGKRCHLSWPQISRGVCIIEGCGHSAWIIVKFMVWEIIYSLHSYFKLGPRTSESLHSR